MKLIINHKLIDMKQDIDNKLLDVKQDIDDIKRIISESEQN